MSFNKQKLHFLDLKTCMQETTVEIEISESENYEYYNKQCFYRFLASLAFLVAGNYFAL